MNKDSVIYLTSGEEVFVDSEDFDRLSEYQWRLHSSGYAVAKQQILMHRLVNETPRGMDTDHINRNKLDNRKSNLRSVTHAQNMLNMGSYKNSISGYKGVRWHKTTKKWEAYICRNKRFISLGYFRCPEQASAHRLESLKNW